MAASISEKSSLGTTNPAVNITRLLRPGTSERFFARLRSASNTLRTPKLPTRFGVRPPTPDWGADIASSYQYILAGYWWETLFPALAIASLVIGVNLITDSIEQVLSS